MSEAIFEVARGARIGGYIERLGRFRIEVFREYPYLYDGEMEYERKYLGRYAARPNSFLIFCEDANGFVAACTGICMDGAGEEFCEIFSQEDTSEICYIGEVMIKEGYRGQGLGSKLLSKAMKLIKEGGYKKAVLCAVDRDEKRHLRPKDYVAPDNLWLKFGFKKLSDKKIYYDWRDIGETCETQKRMSVWSVDL